MKKFAKISAVLAALVLAVAFIGCSSDDDDDDPEVVKVVTWEKQGGSEKEKITFYDDNTFMLEFSDEEDSGSDEGTYSGDPTKDGSEVTLNDGEDEWTIVISGDTFKDK